MYADREVFTFKPYRAPMNPEFVKRAQENRQAAQKKQASLEVQLAAALRHVGQLKLEVKMLRASASAEAKDLAEVAIDASRHRHTYVEIERRACRVFHVSREEIRGEGRAKMVFLARQFIYYWSRRLTRLSTPQIGRLMGGRDHTTVLHGVIAYQIKRKRMGRELRNVK